MPAVFDERRPILSSGAPMRRPRSSEETRNAVMPRVPADGSVIAITTYHCASPALVIQTFEPFKTYDSPSRTARVFWLAASEPDCCSDRA